MRYKQKLPPLICTTLEERSAYHNRFMRTSIVAAGVLLPVLILVIWSLRNEAVGIQFFLGTIWFIFLAMAGYFILHHRKRRRLLDNCLKSDGVSVISGTLDGIQHLGGKRVRYTIDDRHVDGTLVFPGFTAFQNTRVIDVITTFGQPVELYLLPGGLLAGAIYPELDSGPTRRLADAADWRLIAQEQWGGVRLLGLVSLFVSVLLVAICWFIEHQVGGGWDSLGLMLIVFNGVVLLLLGVHALVNWHPIRALMDKHHPSVAVQVYRGIAAEWYLTGTRYHGKGIGISILGSWIRLSGGLHRIRDDLTIADRGFLDPLWTPVKLEYLIYNGRLIYLRSVVPSIKNES